jgi:glycosyltransferase involved in cell wall biosynthesis
VTLPRRPDGRLRLAVMFSMLGPYHVARLNALAAVCDVVGIEGATSSETYAWDKHVGHDRFTRVTLFTDEPIARKSRREIDNRVKSVLNGHRPGVVAVPGWAQSWGFSMLDWAQSNGVPAIVMSDSTAVDFKREWWREQIKRQLIKQFASGLVAGTPHVEYLEQLGMPRALISPGYDVVDNDYFARGARSARERQTILRQQLGLPARYILASSRFVSHKNLARLIEAYARYRASTPGEAMGLVVLGDGPERSELEGLIAARGLSGSVHLPGFKQYDALPAYYGCASLFVHVSLVEPWGLVVNEAMASGLPVVVSNRCGCARDLVDDEKNGYVVDPMDIDSICRAVVSATSSEQNLQTMGRHSEAIIARWGLAAFVKGMSTAASTACSAVPKPAGLTGRALRQALSFQ